MNAGNYEDKQGTCTNYTCTCQNVEANTTKRKETNKQLAIYYVMYMYVYRVTFRGQWQKGAFAPLKTGCLP